MRKFLSLLFALMGCVVSVMSQDVTVTGHVVDETAKKPVEFASVLMKENGRWAVTDKNGRFTIKGVPAGTTVLTVQCLGYSTRTITINTTRDIGNLKVALRAENLQLDEVTVVAKRKRDEATTSYTIDRTALDNQQMVNVSDIATLLPGGKTVNPTLMDDSRLSLRSGSQEQGNASFGTAVEVDGVRLDNNAMTGETAGASTRSISTSNIESVEIVTGIPSVEYGDLSNGVVKVNTRKGKSPFIIEGKLNQHTRQIALNKGFDLGGDKGVLNTSFEHALSFSNAASPHTAYQRNILSFNYMSTFMRSTTPLTLNVGVTGNVGGYSNEADPDRELDDYSKVKDNSLRASFDLHWLLNKSWITNVSLFGSLSLANKTTKNYTHDSSAATRAYIHTKEEGYFITTPFDDDPSAPIVLGPTGEWHYTQYVDSKPLDYALRLKADWARRFGKMLNKVMVGINYTAARNNGRGTYYAEPRYTPTWREYRYDELPTMHNLALFVEDKVSMPVSKRSTLEVTAGLRDDITLISGSDYGTVSSFSPRFNGRYIFWRKQRKRLVSDFEIHAGWGKSVKLPSFQVLYPTPSYYDTQVFNSPSTADNTTQSGYYTRPSKAVYNPSLRWQYTNQTDLGVELTMLGTHINLSAFHHRTHNPYMATTLFTPFSYQYTPISVLPDGAQSYAIDRYTGAVTVGMADGSQVVIDKDYQAADGSKQLTRRTYQSNTRYVNGTPIDRYGVEWMIDFTPIKPLNTTIRFDGNFYYYKGLNDQLFADMPASTVTMTGTNNEPYRYVGWYRGTNGTASATASVSNGTLSKVVNLNTTITTHIPKIRLIVALRLEATLYNYRRALSEYDDAVRGIVLADKGDYFGTPYDGNTENRYVAVYPEYYSTWENPDERIPFAEALLSARDNDPTLYNDLCNLVVKTNYPYTLNANRISSYYSANLSVTKEIGDHVSISFYANNFFNNMKTVNQSQTGLDTSLFSSSYIPSYYYGLSLRLKL